MPKITFDLVLKNICNKIYNQLGVHHRERTYQNALELELISKKLHPIKEYPLKIWYDNYIVNTYFIDLVILNQIPIEIKQVKSLSVCDKKQIKNYMKHIKSEVGYLINFGHYRLEIIKFVNNVETNLLETIMEEDFVIKDIDDIEKN